MQPPKALAVKPVWVTLIVSVAVFGTVFWLHRQEHLRLLESLLYDLNFQWQPVSESSSPVVLVFLDDNSAKAMGKGLNPWSRRDLALALQKLCAMQAAVIGLDMVFSVQSDEPQDAALAEAVSACQNVVLAKTISGKNEILPRFAEAAIGDGFIDLPEDTDGILRRIHYRALQKSEEGIEVVPAFSLDVVRAFRDLPFDFFRDAAGQFRLGAIERSIGLPEPDLVIHFQGDYRRYKHFSLVDVVQGRVPAEAIANRIVLLGTNRVLDRDFFHTPYTRFAGTIYSQVDNAIGINDPGVAIHAQAIETLLAQNFLQPVPMPLFAGVLLLVVLLGSLFYWSLMAGWLELLLCCAVAAAVLGLGFVAFLHNSIVASAALLLALLLQFVGGISWRKYVAANKQRFVTELLGKNVSTQVADAMIQDLDRVLTGQRQIVTLFFSDIRGFTSLSEELSAAETSRLLNHYFGKMLPLISDHQGTVDKLMGDGIMAFFGAPVALSNHAELAARAALATQQALTALREDGIKGCERIQVGIGLNTGEAIIGVLGSQDVWDYTAIGDSVNLASRIEGLNKRYGSTILISEATRQLLSADFLTREVDCVAVKGKHQAVVLHELLGYQSHPQAELIALFGQAVAAFKAHQSAQAKTLFLQVQQHWPEDIPTRLYLDKLAEIEVQGWERWQQVTTMTEK